MRGDKTLLSHNCSTDSVQLASTVRGDKTVGIVLVDLRAEFNWLPPCAVTRLDIGPSVRRAVQVQLASTVRGDKTGSKLLSHDQFCSIGFHRAR